MQPHVLFEREGVLTEPINMLLGLNEVVARELVGFGSRSTDTVSVDSIGNLMEDCDG